MGKQQCCYKKCCPPYPCYSPFPPPCGPCLTPSCCSPCNERCSPDCCEIKSCNEKVDFSGQSNDQVYIYGVYNVPFLLFFTEVGDSGTYYNNNSIFNPICKGKYKICASVPVSEIGENVSAKIQLVTSSGLVKTSSSSISGAAGTLNIDTTVCLNRCDAVFIQIVTTNLPPDSYITVSPSSAPRTFSGYSVNNSCC